MFGRIRHMIIKEFLQMRRDRYARFRLLVPPLIQMLVYGYAATFEVYHVSTVVLDLDHTQESRELVSRFSGSGRFVVQAALTDRRQLIDTIDRGDATVALHIHAGFAELLRKGEGAPLQVILDGTNSNTALLALGYVNQIATRFARDYQVDRLSRRWPALVTTIPEVRLEQRPWYNPDLNSRWFFVPGVVGSLTLVVVVNLTAFAVVREREIGTLEQIMVTPLRPAELIAGKTIPFFIVGLIEAVLITVVGVWWFQVPFQGSVLVLLLGTSLFLLSMLGVGLLISTLCSTQQQAFASNFFFMSPAFLLSGFAFPISSMPAFLQWLTYLDPLRYFLVVLRGTFLKGIGLAVLWPQMLAMAALGATLLTISVLRFRKSLD
jgi:ABC-2 type transport system permease protein